LKGFQYWVVYVIAVAFSCFQVYTAPSVSCPLSFSVPFISLRLCPRLPALPFPGIQVLDRLEWHHYLIAAFAGLVGSYMTLNYMRIMESGGTTPRWTSFRRPGILFTLEAARRVVGLPIVVIAVVFLLYAYLGITSQDSVTPGLLPSANCLPHVPDHRGIMGIPLWVSSTFIYLFVLFGAFRERRDWDNSLLISPTPLPDGPPGAAKVAW